ncbi:hypothetical protein KY321_02745 [Candidatus Woesearchaeota archaeon]|nr:hypothetical protein [Candidatus Woesearchaeota archaeon]
MKRIILIIWCLVFFLTGFLTNSILYSDIEITGNAISNNHSNCSTKIINNTILVEKQCNCTTDLEEVSLEDNLKERAEAFAKLYLEEDFKNLYEFVPRETKKNMDEIKFDELYKPVMYGIRTLYLESGEILTSLKKQELKTMYVDDIIIEENIGYVNFSTRDLRDNLSNTIRKFVLEDNEWKCLDFNIISEGGCISNEDCNANDEFLRESCEKQCRDFRFMRLIEEDSYECKENFCHCKCWNEDYETGTKLRVNLVNKYRQS